MRFTPYHGSPAPFQLVGTGRGGSGNRPRRVFSEAPGPLRRAGAGTGVSPWYGVHERGGRRDESSGRRGDDHDRQCRINGLDVLLNLQPGLARKHQVQEDDIVKVLIDFLEAFLAVGCGLDCQAFRCE